MANRIDKQHLENQPFEDIKRLVLDVERNADVRLIDSEGKRPVTVSREKGGKFKVEVDPSKLNENNVDVIFAQALTQIERLRTEASLVGDENFKEELERCQERSESPQNKLFYNVMYQAVALHKAGVRKPIYRQKLAMVGQKAMDALSLSVEADTLPWHIQFLFALMGVRNGIDVNVIQFVQGLENAGILGRVMHIQTSETERLKLINNNIYPTYEYLYEKDKENWGKEKKDVAGTQKDTAERVEEVVDKKGEGGDGSEEKGEKQGNQEKQGDENESSQQEEEQSGDQQSGDSGGDGGESSSNEDSESTPDYKRRYQTPEGGSFEKDPNGKGYELEIYPPLNGYFSIDRKNYFDQKNLEWENQTNFSVYAQNSQFEGKKYTIKGVVKGNGLKSIPLPNGYVLDKDSLQSKGGNPQVVRDQNGNFFIQISGTCDFSVDFYKEKVPTIISPTSMDVEKIYKGKLSQNAEAALLKAQGAVDPTGKAMMVRDYIVKNHHYPSGKDETDMLNNAKTLQLSLKQNSTSANYLQNLDNAKYLECYSANTLLVGMLRTIGVPSRLVTGHRVDGMNDHNCSVISSGNGHAWCEFWDGARWTRIDATPNVKKDDQNKDDKESEKKSEDSEKKKEDKDESDKKEKTQTEQADDGGIDNNPNSEEGSENQESEKGKEGQEGDGEGKDKGKDGEGKDGKSSDSQEDGEGGKGSGQSQKGGETGKGEGDLKAPKETGDDFDPQKEFEKMYKELEDYTSNEIAEDAVQEAAEQMEQEAQELQIEEKDPLDEIIENKFPEVNESQKESLKSFIRSFEIECAKISQIPNPDAAIDPMNPRLIDALRSILDRVISRSVVEVEVPRYPVADGPILVDPVSLEFAEQEGTADEAQVWLGTEFEPREEMKIVKVRRRKILDGSGSMSSMFGDNAKLDLQQLIEVLENIVTAEKQKELDVLSEELNRDLRLETETWQFGVSDQSTGLDYRRLKKLAPTFDIVEQALTWHMAGEAAGGTNDYDPLEAIYAELLEEHSVQKEIAPNSPSNLERINAGFCIRELKNLQELEEKGEDEMTRNEKRYYQNLIKNKPKFEKALDDLKMKYAETVEGIIEVIEITTDGGSNSSERVQEIIGKLRNLGVIVIAYGIGEDGKTAKTTYANAYNPMEGGHYCLNLLAYPREKLKAWERILDKI